MKLTNKSILLKSACVLIASSLRLRGDILTLPDVGPYDVTSAIPFYGVASVSRYQQIYFSSSFSQPVLIKSIAFSLIQAQTGNPPFSGTLAFSDISLSLSVSTRTSSSFSSDVSANVTGPETTVFSAVGYSPTISATDFNLVLDFSSTPFLYNPQHRSLLLDMSFGEITGDAAVGLRAGNELRAFQTTMTSLSDVETIPTQFDFTPTSVPEPSSSVLLLIGTNTTIVFLGGDFEFIQDAYK